MKQEEDFALWNQFLEGDEKAYLYIYKLYAQDMYSYGMLFTANSELVKDCLHDVFVKIHRNRKKLSSEPLHMACARFQSCALRYSGCSCAPARRSLSYF